MRQQLVHQSRFSRIGISDQRNPRKGGRESLFPLNRPFLVDPVQLSSKLSHPPLNMAPVQFQLGLSHTFIRKSSASPRLPAKVRPHSGKPWHQILQSGIFHLQSGLSGSGTIGKNAKNQPGPVHHFHIQDLLQIPELCRRQHFIEYNSPCMRSVKHCL